MKEEKKINLVSFRSFRILSIMWRYYHNHMELPIRLNSWTLKKLLFLKEIYQGH